MMNETTFKIQLVVRSDDQSLILNGLAGRLRLLPGVIAVEVVSASSDASVDLLLPVSFDSGGNGERLHRRVMAEIVDTKNIEVFGIQYDATAMFGKQS